MSEIRPFEEYMMEAENAPLWKGKGKAYHESPEGGTKTLGFGHKLSLVEQDAKSVQGIPVEEYDKDRSGELLKKDLATVYSRLKKKLPQHWEQLPQRSKEMLADIEYNVRGGINAYPSFTRAVLRGDIEGQRAEYERKYRPARCRPEDRETSGPNRGKCKLVPIQERNRLFEERFLTPEAIKAWGKSRTKAE